MTDPKQALVQALSIMGLKARDAEQIVTTLKESHQVEVDDSEGFLSLKQNGADVNPATVLQAYFRQHPQDFIGHSGEIRYKSDVKDDKAKVALIREKGIDYWTALPATENGELTYCTACRQARHRLDTDEAQRMAATDSPRKDSSNHIMGQQSNRHRVRDSIQTVIKIRPV